MFSVEYRIINENLLYVVFVRGQDVWFVQFLSTAPFWNLNAMFQYCLYMVSHSSSQDTQDAAASRKCFSGVMKGTFAWDNSCSVTWQGAVSMAKMQAFPMSAHVPLLLCLAGKEGAGGPSVKGSRFVAGWTTLLSISLSLCSWRGWQRLSLAVSHRWLCCDALRYCQDGSWLLTKSRSGLVVQSPVCCALTRHRNE